MTKNNGTSATLDTVAEELTEDQASGITPMALVEYDPTTEDDEEEAAYRALVWKLDEPLDRSRIKKRKGFGDGKELSYLTHSDVTATMNRIFGYGKWNYSVVDKHFFTEEGSGIPRAVCVTVEVSVYLGSFHSSMTSIGYAVVSPKRDGTYTWGAVEMALGNAEAKAFKRAVSKHGPQFGLSLYDDDTEADQADVAETKATTTTHTATSSKAEIVNGVAHCEDCNKAIRGYTNQKGKTYTTEDLVDMSKKQTGGHVLCLDCRQKRAGGD